MFRKSVIATAAAAVLAVGLLPATSASASTTLVGSGYVSGPGWSLSWGGHYPWPHKPPVRKVCKPVFKTVKWYDKWGHIHFKKIYKGQECFWQPVYLPRKPYPFKGPFKHY